MKKTPISKAYKIMPDLTRTVSGEKSVGSKLELLVKNAETYRKNPNELKEEILKILDDPTTHASALTVEKYKEALKHQYTFPQICTLMSNIYLAAAKMKLV